MANDRMPRLVLLNGPPGIGKSTLARRYVRDRALAFCLDIDVIRRLIGKWDSDLEAPGLLARKMALAMAGTHLTEGHDVVVPQYVARAEFIEQLAETAASSGASFHEVYLTATKSDALDRFEARKHDPDGAAHHAEAVRTLGGAEGLEQMIDAIEAMRRDRPHALVVETRTGNEDDAYTALLEVLNA